jgi:hypothetical protein
LPTYRDTNFNSDPDRIAAQLKNEIKEKMVTSDPLSFGVLVMEGRGQGKQRPRVLVLGTDSYCNDEALARLRSPETYISHMGGMVDLVRERRQGMNIEPRALGLYTLPRTLDPIGLFLLPLSIIFLGILALGGGVWITRRQ